MTQRMSKSKKSMQIGEEAQKKSKSSADTRSKATAGPISPTSEPDLGVSHANKSGSINPPQGEGLPEIPPEMTLPMTPKSPESRSPVTAVTEISSQPTEIALPPPLRTAAANRDVAAVGQLLSSMKDTIKAIGNTFDKLGEQTIRVAQLGPAIDATHQVSQVGKDLEEQHQRQEEKMQEAKTMFLTQLKTQLHTRLKEKASMIVKEIVKREIAERVRKELHLQIPKNLREEVVEYKRQISEVKIGLHNSEARRHNALIRSNSIEEPLRPLLRPLSQHAATSQVASSIASVYGSLDTPVSPAEKQDTKGPSLKINVRLGSPAKTADLSLPTPSPLFPKNLASLIRLSHDDAKTLVRHYGLVRFKAVGPVTASSDRSVSDSLLFSPLGAPRSPEESKAIGDLEEVEETREEALNRFLTYIGVGFQLVPTSPPGGKTSPLPTSPLMTRTVYPQ